MSDDQFRVTVGRKSVWYSKTPKAPTQAVPGVVTEKPRCVAESRKIIEVLGKITTASWERCHGQALKGDVVCPIHRRIIDKAVATDFCAIPGARTKVRVPVTAFLAPTCKWSLAAWSQSNQSTTPSIPADDYMYEIETNNSQYDGMDIRHHLVKYINEHK